MKNKKRTKQGRPVGRRPGLWLSELEGRLTPVVMEVGAEFAVNTTAANRQITPAAAADGAGNFVLVWASRESDANLFDIRGRQFDAAGKAGKDDFVVNTTVSDNQQEPDVGADAAGNFVVVWQSFSLADDNEVVAQRYNAQGTKQGGEIAINTSKVGDQQTPRVAVDVDGDFTVAWVSSKDNADGLRTDETVVVRRFDRQGMPLGGEEVLTAVTANAPGALVGVDVGSDAAGNGFVVWSAPATNGRDVFGRRVNATDGKVVADAFTVSVETAKDQSVPAVAVDVAGNAVVVWQSASQDGDGLGVFARRFGPDGKAVDAADLAVNTTTVGNQQNPEVAAFPGGFAVVFQSAGQGTDVLFRQFVGAAGKAELVVSNDVQANNQLNPVVAANAAGSIVATGWQDNQRDGSLDGIFGQRLAEGADLQVTLTAAPSPVTTGGMLTYTVTVRNVGPAGAATPRVTFPVPAGTTFVSATPSQGTAAVTVPGAGGTVAADLGVLPLNQTATVTVVVTAGATPGTATATATVASVEADPTPADNTATVTTTVQAPPQARPAGRIVQASDQADPAAGPTVRFTVTFTRAVTGFDAADVILTGLAGLTVQSVSGSGANYTVTVAGATAAGTVTAAIRDAAATAVDDNQTSTFDATGDRSVTVFVPSALPRTFAVGTDVGGDGSVISYNPDKTVRFTVQPFGTFAGGVRVATGDFNGDGVADIVAGTGPGRATRVVVLDGMTKAELFAVDPFEASFTGGVYVAAGDITGDGKADLVITPDEGGGPRVDIYSGAGFGKFASFFGIDDPNFRGGARASTGDINGDGRADLLVVAGFGGGPRVAGFDGKSIGGTPARIFGDFFAFEQTLRNGVFVTAGDIDGDGFAELIAGGGPGGGPRVTAFSGKDLLTNVQTVRANFFGGDPNSRGGIRVTVKNLDGDNRADIVVGAGAGAGSRVTAYAGSAIAPQGSPAELFAFDAVPGFSGGVFVG